MPPISGIPQGGATAAGQSYGAASCLHDLLPPLRPAQTLREELREATQLLNLHLGSYIATAAAFKGRVNERLGREAKDGTEQRLKIGTESLSDLKRMAGVMASLADGTVARRQGGMLHQLCDHGLGATGPQRIVELVEAEQQRAVTQGEERDAAE